MHFDLIAVADAADHVGFTGKVGCIQYRSGICAGETDPVISPGGLIVCTVTDFSVRANEKCVAGLQFISDAMDRVSPLSGTDIVDQVMIAYSGTPFVAGCTFLVPDIVHAEGHDRALFYFIARFKFVSHLCFLLNDMKAGEYGSSLPETGIHLL